MYDTCLSLNPDFREVFTNYADALKETGNLTRLEALVRTPALQDRKDSLAARAFIHLTESHQVAGNHAYCVDLMDGYNPLECGPLVSANAPPSPCLACPFPMLLIFIKVREKEGG
jgi:hypothetical protein